MSMKSPVSFYFVRPDSAITFAIDIKQYSADIKIDSPFKRRRRQAVPSVLTDVSILAAMFSFSL